MPVEGCQLNNKPGYRWGKQGKCYTYDPNSKSAKTRAWNKAKAQGVKIGDYMREVMDLLRKLRRKK